jgi:hypothetical protein
MLYMLKTRCFYMGSNMLQIPMFFMGNAHPSQVSFLVEDVYDAMRA